MIAIMYYPKYEPPTKPNTVARTINVDSKSLNNVLELLVHSNQHIF